MLSYAWGAGSANKASPLEFQDEGGEPGPSDPLGFNMAFTTKGPVTKGARRSRGPTHLTLTPQLSPPLNPGASFLSVHNQDQSPC